MIKSSIMVSLILGLPDWMTKTSFSRTLVMIFTLVSPCQMRDLHSVMRHSKQPLPPGGLPSGQATYIGELRELSDAGRHPQVLTYLSSEGRAGCAGKYHRIPHGFVSGNDGRNPENAKCRVSRGWKGIKFLVGFSCALCKLVRLGKEGSSICHHRSVACDRRSFNLVSIVTPSAV